ncbi:hypothetical protein VNO77_17449 [Canavalia gladiata]|uniref:Uncharacterized protein n=1 Tax=Canavalia gladiata TaxID=3824 RepID=A0AAN9LMM2_CANGL
MGCFLHCFGSSQHTKQRRKTPHHRVTRNASGRPQQLPSPVVSSVEVHVQDSSTSTIASQIQIQAKPDASPRKRVTFDSNVKTYEAYEVVNFQSEKSEEEEALVTSMESYPTNHRYHNCSHGDDDEDGERDYWDSDLTDDDDDDDDDDGDSDMGEEYDELGEGFEDGIVYSSSRNGANQVRDEDVNPNARDRSLYVHSVLNPVENLTQWKAVKAKRAPSLMSRKENFILNQESPTVSAKKLNQEMAVDASLSNWLVSSETTPVNKALYVGTPERSSSQGSNSVISHEDRPILGALTVEEIKQFSASSSPRKSPIRCVDEMPIIGSVGTYWNFGNSGSPATFEGTPNRPTSRGVHLK